VTINSTTPLPAISLATYFRWTNTPGLRATGGPPTNTSRAGLNAAPPPPPPTIAYSFLQAAFSGICLHRRCGTSPFASGWLPVAPTRKGRLVAPPTSIPPVTLHAAARLWHGVQQRYGGSWIPHGTRADSLSRNATGDIRRAPRVPCLTFVAGTTVARPNVYILYKSRPFPDAQHVADDWRHRRTVSERI